jgi:hypothetical protein
MENSAQPPHLARLCHQKCLPTGHIFALALASEPISRSNRAAPFAASCSISRGEMFGLHPIQAACSRMPFRENRPPGILSREMIRRIICKVLRLVRRRSPTLRTHNPLTSNSRAMSFRKGASSCRTYSGSATRKRCATRNLSARTAVRRAITRSTRLESPFRRPLTTPRTRWAADLALMKAITNFDCRY